MRRVGLLVVLASLGCSSDGASDSRAEQARPVIAQSLQESGESDPNSLQFTADEAGCAAERIVGAIDLARLEDLGLDVEDDVGPELSEPPLTEGEADVVFGSYESCIDLSAQLGELFASDGSLGAEAAQCVADAYITSGILRQALLSPGFDEELNTRIDGVLADAYEACPG